MKTTPPNHKRVLPPRAVMRTALATFVLLTATAGFSQTTYIWTGAANGTNLGTAGNWNPNGLPSGSTQDTAEWNGTVPGSLLLDYGAQGWPNTGFGTEGVILYMNAAQTLPVTIVSPVASSAAVGIYGFTIDSGAGIFTLGDGSGNLYQAADRPAGAVHPWMNNSANAAIVNASVRWVAGGGNANTIDFQGSGNWIVTNYLRDDNGAGPRTIQSDSTGTIIWVADPVQRGNSPTGPVNIDSGTVVLKSPGLIPFENPGAVPPGNNTILNNALLEYDAGVGSAADNQQRVISGNGNIQVNSGTLDLSGQNTYTGSNILTGGELIANSAETPGTSGPLGLGTNTFAGGTLGFSANNTFDYSSRFDPSPNQAYNIDTAGQDVTFATGLDSSGGTLTKIGSGTLTLSGTSAYTGATTVAAGKLALQGPTSGTPSINVEDSATLGVYGGSPITLSGTLTLGSSSGATLEYNNVSSTIAAPVTAGTLASAPSVTINVISGSLTPGQSYPLLTWTTGTAPIFNLGILNGFVGNLSVSGGHTLVLNITATAYKWTGLTSGSWDLTTANNWVQNGGPVIFANGAPTLFDDSATGATNITVGALVEPTILTINNNSLIYSIASSGANNIGGTATFMKSGTSSLTLSGGANTYTGVTTVSGGVLSVSKLANGGSASDIGAAANSAANLVLNGGTLQYTNGGAVSIDRLFTVGTSGGTIDGSGTGGLTLNNTGAVGLSGSGARTLTLTGSDVNGETLAASLADNVGSSSMIKNGSNQWTLSGNNTYSGPTTINSGVLQVGAGGATGSPGTGSVLNNGALVFNRTGTLTVNSAISGSGPVTNNGTGTLILSANNTYQGGTYNNAGTLQIGNGGSTGSTEINASITNNGTLVYNTTGSYSLNGNIGGTGQVIVGGSGLLILQGTEAYTGGLTVNSGAQLEIFKGNQGSYSATGNITNNGTIYFVRQDNGVAGITNNIIGNGRIFEDVNNANSGDTTLLGVNTYTNGTFIAGGGFILGDGVTPGAGSIVGNVTFTNSQLAAFDTFRKLEFMRPEAVLNFTNPILGPGGTKTGGFIGNAGAVVQSGTNTVILTGPNSWIGGVIASNGVLVLGNGGANGFSGTGGNLDAEAGAQVVFDLSSNVGVTNPCTGGGTLVQEGTGTLTLLATNNVIQNIVVSNGTLVLYSASNSVDVAGGTLITAGTAPGTLLVISNMNIAGGNVNMAINTSLALSNSFVLVTNIVTDTNALTTNGFNGTITYTGGTLNLNNVGPALAVGDRFVLFSQPVTGGASMPIVSAGFTVHNNLAVDGSVTVTAVTPSVPAKFKSITISGGNVIITATNNSGQPGGTYHLLATNNVAAPLSTWPVISTGSFDNTGNLALTNAVGSGRLFYDLQVP